MSETSKLIGENYQKQQQQQQRAIKSEATAGEGKSSFSLHLRTYRVQFCYERTNCIQTVISKQKAS